MKNLINMWNKELSRVISRHPDAWLKDQLKRAMNAQDARTYDSEVSKTTNESFRKYWGQTCNAISGRASRSSEWSQHKAAYYNDAFKTASTYWTEFVAAVVAAKYVDPSEHPAVMVAQHIVSRGFVLFRTDRGWEAIPNETFALKQEVDIQTDRNLDSWRKDLEQCFGVVFTSKPIDKMVHEWATKLRNSNIAKAIKSGQFWLRWKRDQLVMELVEAVLLTDGSKRMVLEAVDEWRDREKKEFRVGNNGELWHFPSGQSGTQIYCHENHLPSFSGDPYNGGLYNTSVYSRTRWSRNTCGTCGKKEQDQEQQSTNGVERYHAPSELFFHHWARSEKKVVWKCPECITENDPCFSSNLI